MTHPPEFIERIDFLVSKQKKYREDAMSLKSSHDAYLAAVQNEQAANEAILEEVRAAGLFKTQDPQHQVIKTPSGNIDVEQLEAKVKKVVFGSTQVIERLDELVNNSAENDMIVLAKTCLVFLQDTLYPLLRKEKKAKNEEEASNPEYNISTSFSNPLVPSVPNPHGQIVVQVERVAGIPGVYLHDPLVVRNMCRGQLVKFNYTEVIGNHPPDPNVKLRVSKKPCEVMGMIEDDYGVWETNDGNWCLRLRNMNLLTKGDPSKLTFEDLDKYKAQLKTYKGMPGEYPFRTYRLEGIRPGTFQACRGGKWHLVPIVI